MTGINAITFLLMATLTPLAAVIIYALLVQKGTLPLPRQKFKELVAAGEAEAAWRNHVLFMTKMGFWPLGLAASKLGTSVFGAGPIVSIHSSELTFILLLIACAAFQFAIGTWELSRGWEKAKTGRTGQYVYKMIDAHQAVQTITPKGAER